MAGRELFNFKQVNNKNPLEDWGSGQFHLILVLMTEQKYKNEQINSLRPKCLEGRLEVHIAGAGLSGRAIEKG